MDNILKEDRSFASAYIDDICCHTNSDFEDHLEKLDKVLTSIGKHGMTLKLSKCKFAKKSVKFLGFEVGEGIIRPITDKLQVIKNLPEPTNKKGIRSFLAMCRFYAKHLEKFSELSATLSDMTKNKARGTFIFDDKQRAAFEGMKQSIMKAQSLHAPDLNKEFYVTCDCSDVALSGMLSQKNENGHMYPIEFLSKKLTDTQKVWPIVVREAFAILYSLQHWDHLLWGSKIVIQSDSSPLTYILHQFPSSPKLIRWSLALSRWGADISFVPGSQNPSDHLSRNVK